MQNGLAFAGLTEQLQDQLERTQRNAFDELTQIVAQGRFEIHSSSTLARNEHELAVTEARRFQDECNIAHNVRVDASASQDTLRAELVNLYNRMHRQEVEQRETEIRLRDELLSTEVALQMQVTDLNLEVKQESRVAADSSLHAENLGKDLFEARQQIKMCTAS